MESFEKVLRQAVADALEAEARGTFERVLLDVLPGALRRAQLPPLLSRHDLAEATGLSLSGIDAMRRSGRLPYVKVGSRVFFKVEDVDHLIADAYVGKRAGNTRIRPSN